MLNDMSHYAVSIPGTSGHIFSSRAEALIFVQKNPNCYLRQFSSHRDAQDFVNYNGGQIGSTAMSTAKPILSIPSCTIISIEPSSGKYTATVTLGSGNRNIITNPVPGEVKSSSIICIMAINHLMSIIEGDIKFICTDPTLQMMHKKSQQWINFRPEEKGIFSQLIADTFKQMQERKIELLKNPPLGMA
jgi:hypothetical protein